MTKASNFRVENHHGNDIVCGGILPHRLLEVGQKWQGSSGGVVEITRLESFGTEPGDLIVHYESPSQKPHHKLSFSFQCRYCLVLKDGQTLQTLFQEKP